MQRYEWSDALVDAQTQGRIGNGALLAAMKLARAMNWKPANGRPVGLYWKNDDAFRHVGLSRATYYRYQPSLIETGFIKVVNGNIIPTMPESQIETLESQSETTESQSETAKSQVEHTLTVDTLSDDTCSEDTCSEEAASPPKNVKASLSEGATLPNMEGEARQPEDFRESQSETLDEVFASTWRMMDDHIRQYFEKSGATQEQLKTAVVAYGSIHSAHGWVDKAEKALSKAGVEVETW